MIRFGRQNGLSTLETIVLVAIVLIGGGTLYVIGQQGLVAGRVAEERAVPVIAALERYKGENGKYPPALKDLVPKYLAEPPSCSATGSGGMAYFLDTATGQYEIICPTGMFSKRGYSSATGKWSSFD